MSIEKINIDDLDAKAREIIENSDQGAIMDLFGDCETVEDINAVGEAVYEEVMG